MTAASAVLLVLCTLSNPAPKEPTPQVSLPVVNTPASVSPDWLPPRPGTNLRIDIRDSTSDLPLPAKLTILGREGSENPLLARGTSRLETWGALAYHRAYVSGDTAALSLPDGRYDIWVSRGIAYTRAVARDVVVRAGEPLVLEARLHKAVSMGGWVSADLHVHTAMSKDSPVPLASRVHQFAAAGVDVLVATDHNYATDLSSVVSKLGLGDVVATITGQEMTTYGNGHFGVFPLTVEPHKSRRGAIATGSPSEMFSAVRSAAPSAALIVNHPWSGRHGYFTRGQLTATDLQFGRRGFAFGFDAIELVNGYEIPFAEMTEHHLQEWFALLRAGLIVTATGNSDSHKLALNQGGYPRNYLRTGGATDGLAVAQAVIAGRSMLTTGPLIQLRVAGVDIGGTVVTTTGEELQVELEVTAAPWIDVSTVTLWVGGEQHRAWNVARHGPPDNPTLRLAASLTLPATGDTFVVVTAAGEEPLWPVVGERSWDCHRFRFKRRTCRDLHLDVAPLAVTNPVFIDTDGNGSYDPIAPTDTTPSTPAVGPGDKRLRGTTE